MSGKASKQDVSKQRASSVGALLVVPTLSNIPTFTTNLNNNGNQIGGPRDNSIRQMKRTNVNTNLIGVPNNQSRLPNKKRKQIVV